MSASRLYLPKRDTTSFFRMVLRIFSILDNDALVSLPVCSCLTYEGPKLSCLPVVWPEQN